MRTSAGIIARYFYTIKYLKLTQLLYLVVNRLQKVYQSKFNGTLPINPSAISHKTIRPAAPFINKSTASKEELSRHSFTFLNETHSFNRSIAWQTSSPSRLWRYNLHYFDYLLPKRENDYCAGDQLIRDWIDGNPFGVSDAWDPFPTALRIVNWIKFIYQHKDTVPEPGEYITRSLYAQTLHLERRLEFHLLGNHLFKNIKALLFAGLYFKGEDSARWRKKGIRLLKNELREQVLGDGGHFERSPMYHAMILEDVIDLINVFADIVGYEALTLELHTHARRMIFFLSAMTHPDGDIALFNDAALGIEHPSETLINYYRTVTGLPAPKPLPGPIASFPESGYFIMSPADGDKMIIDCGQVGPDYQPGHAHSDTLSFELSLGGRRIIVDSGCCQYTDSPIRKYNRGNDGHNSLTLDERNQSEVWGAHRCARRAQPKLNVFREERDGSLVFKGAHDGYRRLQGKPMHERTIRWLGNQICIDDTVTGHGRHRITLNLHLHPDLQVKEEGGGVIVSDVSRDLAVIHSKSGQDIEIGDGWYCPEFNRQLACKKLVVTFSTSLPAETGWKFNIILKR